jgi:hypothetical protein
MTAALAFPMEERVYKEYKEDKKKGLVKHLRKYRNHPTRKIQP